MVKSLLQAGADLEIRNNEGNTPLFEATLSGVPAGVELLLEAGSDPMARNSNGDTPLHLAVAKNQKEICQSFTFQGGFNSCTECCRKDSLPPGNGRFPRYGEYPPYQDRLALSDDFGKSPLHIAVQSEAPLPIIQTIVELGARLNMVDSQGKTPLRLAVDSEAWETARYLIDAGADLFIKASERGLPPQ